MGTWDLGLVLLMENLFQVWWEEHPVFAERVVCVCGYDHVLASGHVVN